MKYSDQKDNRSRRRPGPQTPLLLPLLLLCLGVTLWGANGGCVMTPGGDEIQSGGGPPTDAIARAVQLLQQGDGATAMGSIQQIVRDMGDTSMAASAVADELTRRSRPDAAVQLLQSWKEKHADALWDPMLWMSLSQAQLSAGDKDAAATTEKEGATRASEIMKEIGRYNPATSPLVPTPTRDAVIKLLQAAAFYSASDAAFDFAKTRMALEEAYRLTPKDPVIINQLGYTLADKGSTKAEYDRAAELTQQAVALAPRQWDDYGFLRMGAVQEGRSAGSAAYFARSGGRRPGHS